MRCDWRRRAWPAESKPISRRDAKAAEKNRIPFYSGCCAGLAKNLFRSSLRALRLCVKNLYFGCCTGPRTWSAKSKTYFTQRRKGRRERSNSLLFQLPNGPGRSSMGNPPRLPRNDIPFFSAGFASPREKSLLRLRHGRAWPAEEQNLFHAETQSPQRKIEFPLISAAARGRRRTYSVLLCGLCVSA
jgi:hypothetical protein